MTDHIVYLANSSGVKVGITRATQVPTRWIDQGATQALPISCAWLPGSSPGSSKTCCAARWPDKTNWRALLKGDAAPVDLLAVREQLFDSCGAGVTELQQRFGLQAIQPLSAAEVLEIRYPIEAYPAKINRFQPGQAAAGRRYPARYQGSVPDVRHRRDQYPQVHRLSAGHPPSPPGTPLPPAL